MKSRRILQFKRGVPRDELHSPMHLLRLGSVRAVEVEEQYLEEVDAVNSAVIGVEEEEGLVMMDDAKMA